MTDDLMVQEQVSNPWQHMVGVICLNLTNRKQVKAVLPIFFAKWSTAIDFLKADTQDIKNTIKSLGMVNVRTKRLLQMTEDYMNWDHVDAKKLHGIGKYGSDSYNIFYKNIVPKNVQDKELLRYLRLQNKI